MHRTALLVCATLVAACANEYTYVPTTTTSATVAGRPAADYAVPFDHPSGDVRLATFGIAPVTPQGEPDLKIKALHLRMSVANDSAVPWTVDTREQRVTIANAGESRAAFAAADGGTSPPIVQIAPSGRRKIDLFFPLPQSMQNESKVPEFDVQWTVHATSGPVTLRTPFERLEVQPTYDYESGDTAYGWDSDYDGFGWGEPYYNPAYAYGAFNGAYWGPRFVGRPVVIDRPNGFRGGRH